MMWKSSLCFLVLVIDVGTYCGSSYSTEITPDKNADEDVMLNDDNRPIKTNHYNGLKNKRPIKNTNVFIGGCKIQPDAPINGNLHCSRDSCRARCEFNYQFPNGDHQLIIVCHNGEWRIDGTEWTSVPHCEPICSPQCRNNGICINPNQCQCPEYYSGPQCQYEAKPCLNFPSPVQNSRQRCNTKMCTITCEKGFVFPDGSAIAISQCRNGNWIPSKSHWITIPDCQTTCSPKCENSGVCLPLNVCQCPQMFRGPQCQYSKDECTVQKLGFNGGYNCTGDADLFSCTLHCPPGVDFTFPPASKYICTYDNGIFQPQPIPQCNDGPDYQIIPVKSSENSYIRTTNHSWIIQGTSVSKLSTENQIKNNISNDKNKVSSVIKSDMKTAYIYNTTDEGRNRNNVPRRYYETFNEASMTVEQKQPKPKICFTWGGIHYKTFDGDIYTFNSKCAHTLIQEIQDGTFTITLQNSPSCQNDNGICHIILRFYLRNKEYLLQLNENGHPTIKIGEKNLPIPGQFPGLRVQMEAHFIIVSMDSVGAIVKWDGELFVQVKASESLWNRTAGLCGRMNGDINDDKTTHDYNHPEKMETFASDWKITNFDEICDELPSTIDYCDLAMNLTQEAAMFCAELFLDKRFDACLNVVDLTMLKNTCELDYCRCKESDKKKCACSAMKIYLRQCHHDRIINSIAWQHFNDVCPMTCTGGKVYNTCAPKTQLTCSNDVTINSIDNSECEAGCACPDATVLHEGECISIEQCPCTLYGKLFKAGAKISKKCNSCTCSSSKWICTEILCSARCAAIGDPHYVTFDGKRYDFMGKCNYYMIKGDNYSVETENIACSGAISEAMGLTSTSLNAPSCTKSVTIRLENTAIKLKQHHQVVINGEEIEKFPVKISNTKIRMASSIFIIVNMPNGLEIWWDGISRIYINAPPEFRDKTKGLCGTFSMNQKDDFLTPMGDIEQSVVQFANKWKTTEQCDDIPINKFYHTCEINPERYETSKKHCSKIWDNIFSNCHSHVDPQSFYDDCMYDMCACETNIKRCLCPTFAAYAEECAASDIKIFWRLEIDICQLHCPENQQYQICGNSCTRSCNDITFNEDCRQSCVEGCNCPEGQTLNIHGECVLIGQCPCEHNGIEFVAGHREIRPGIKTQELCTCAGGLWFCRTATPNEIDEYPAARDLKTICTTKNHLQISDCEPIEPRTCRNMHERINQTPIVCRSGCVCQDDYVLDIPSGHCIKYEMCPCYHGGKSYRENATIQENCNTCQCHNGKWNCTNKICPGICAAWGDSHFTTFDDKSFDFQGACDYVLAKGTFGYDDCFDVSIQNVPCGSTGVTCSKSISLTVGKGINQEIVTLTYGKSLPHNTFKRISIRKIGLFVFLDVPDLGLVIQWDEGTRIYVKLEPKWRGHTKGLCGDYNDDSEDDFKSPSGGISEASPRLFADSWKKNNYCPESKDITDTCAVHPERKIWATEKCGILKSQLFESCHSEVDIAPFIERCIFDTCGCDSGGDCECMCTSLAAYAHECNIRGVPIHWRSQKLCPMQCDEKYSTYSSCMSTCPQETCDNKAIFYDRRHSCNQDTCIEGCIIKPCPIGQVYTNSSFTECIPRVTCKRVCSEIAGITYYEGDKVSSDTCQTCYCSRSKIICSGAPCVTTLIEPTTIPMEQSEECIDGWSAWFNRKSPKSNNNNVSEIFIDIESLPTMLELLGSMNSSHCMKNQMVDIRCRTVYDHKTPKETLNDVVCDLERGLYCKNIEINSVSCEDFEISVLCQCSNILSTTVPIGIDITTAIPINANNCNVHYPYQAHSNNCHEFYQCVPTINRTEFVKKTCGSNMMYNPTLQICDWPHNVLIVRPECHTLMPSTTAITPERCKTNEHWDECAHKCSQTCQFYRYILTEKNICMSDDDCVPGCTSDSNICPLNKFWRDPHTCVELADCSCKSYHGKSVKPGDVIEESKCELCQCLSNYYTCDKSLCVTTEKLELNTEKIITHPDDSNHHTIIIASTNSPAARCITGKYTSLLDENIADIIFNASTSAGSKFAPRMAKFTLSKKITSTSSYWKPKYMDTKQWIDVKLPRLSPVYGVIIQGTPVGDEYVTSYRVLFSQKGDETFSYILENYEPKIFHGPIDSVMPIRQFFEQPIEAKVIRINPLTWHHQIAIRVDLIGCADYLNTYYSYESTTTTTTSIPQSIHEILSKTPICDDLMGLDSGIMAKEQVVASSTLDNLIPDLKLSSPGIWRPKLDNPNQYIQFDFLQNRNITGIETKGADNIWTKAYKVSYGENDLNWNQILDDIGNEKIFLGNFDDKTVKINYFDEPVSARYLRIQPIKWHQHIGLKAEIHGCFIPYPKNEESSVVINTIASPCKVCHEIFQISQNEICQCNSTLWWNGEKCIEKSQCPCVNDEILYAVGTTFETEDCQKCVCAMGGAKICQLKICEPCNEPNTQAVVTELCGCTCKPCPLNMKLCRTSNVCINESLWCNGVKDCPDDETNCEFEATADTNSTNITSHTIVGITTIEMKNVTEMPCETPVCPSGYKLVPLKKSTPTRTSYYSSSLELTKEDVKGGSKNKGYGKGQQLKRIPKKSRKNDFQKNVRLKSYGIGCQTFSCAPIKPPLLIFDNQMKPIDCPKVECPPNYRVIFEPMSIYKPVPCPLYICKPPEPIQAICNVSGTTFNTFDDMEFKYDICNHILAREMYQNKWYIMLEKHCEVQHHPCIQVLALNIDNDIIILYPDMHVGINEYKFTPKQVNRLVDKHKTFKLSKIGNILYFVSNKYGFWIIWDENSNVKIGIPKQLMYQVDGLCGYFDDNTDNDRQKPDGSQAITSEDFGDSWKMDGMSDCEQQTCSRYIFVQAHEICNNINDRLFIACNNVIDMRKYSSRCLETMCVCLSGNITKENCRCRALNSFVTDCQAANSNIDLSTWRNIYNCPMHCPVPFIYKECFRNKCEMTCDNLQEIEPCPKMTGVCFSGCFCPDGLIRNGDNCIPASECRDCICNGFGNSNFINFDKKNFTFMGSCTYVLSRDKNAIIGNNVQDGNTYQILMTNVPCELGSCIQALSVVYKEHYLQIEQNENFKEFSLVLDGEAINKFPYKNSFMSLERDTENNLILLIPTIQMQVISYYHNFAFMIRLPSHIFGGAMEGLCGNCNANDEDDFKKLNGDLTDNIDEFGLSWLVTELPQTRFLNTADCKISKTITKCEPPLITNDLCATLLNTEFFGHCHNLIDPTPFLNSCYETLCKKGDVCVDIEAYARNCRYSGLCPNWRNYNLCPYKCPEHLIYRPCGPACSDTCDSLNIVEKPKCDQEYVEGCFCPENQVSHNGTCVSRQKCFICDDSGHIDGDIWHPDKCTTCSCNKKIINCQTTQCPILETICQENFTPMVAVESENECCLKYLCIPVSTMSPICNESTQVECGYGQIMRTTIGLDGCQKFICECLPPESCPILIDAITSEVENSVIQQGYVKVINITGCCPRVVNICKPETCPLPPVCLMHYILKVIEIPDSCCTFYECQLPKNICLYTRISNNDIKNESNVITMKAGAQWQDGACTNCICEELIDGNVKASCVTTKCAKMNSHLGNDEFVFEEKIITDQCCPLIERVACKDKGKRYEIGEIWHPNGNDPCEIVKCVNGTNGVQKKTVEQECNNACDKGFEYTESKNKEVHCCGTCIAIACVVNGSLRAIGENWRSNDYCINYECLSDNGTLRVVEKIDRCDELDLREMVNYVIDIRKIPGQCCPNYIRTGCRSLDKIYQPESTWKNDGNNCITEICSMKSNHIELQRTVEICNRSCELGWEYEEPIEKQCCGRCKQTFCIVDGNLHQSGTVWYSKDNCTTYECKNSDDQLVIITSSQTCPDISNCPTAEIYNDGCCQKCHMTMLNLRETCMAEVLELNTTIGILSEKRGVHGICRNFEPINGLTECHGNCHSSTYLNRISWIQETNCQCCQPIEMKSIMVDLTCQDGKIFEKEILAPKECSCDACESTKRPIKGRRLATEQYNI